MKAAITDLTLAILDSLQHKGRFSQFTLPRSQHVAITSEAKILAGAAHLNFYSVLTGKGVNLLACPKAGDWTWKVQVVV